MEDAPKPIKKIPIHVQVCNDESKNLWPINRLLSTDMNFSVTTNNKVNLINRMFLRAIQKILKGKKFCHKFAELRTESESFLFSALSNP